MDEIDHYATPLFIMLMVAAIILAIGLSVSAYVDSQIKSKDRTNQIMAACMNGKPIMVGDEIMRCSIVKYNLVKGMKK